MKKTSANTKKVGKQKIADDKTDTGDTGDIADTIAKQLIKNTPKLLIKGGDKLSKETQEGISEFLHFIETNNESSTEDDCYTIAILQKKYEEFTRYKDEQTNDRIHEKFSMLIEKIKKNKEENIRDYEKSVSKLLNYIMYILQEALSPIYNYDNLIFWDNTDEGTGKTYKLLTVLNNEIELSPVQKVALENYNKELVEILDMFSDFEKAIKEDNPPSNLDNLYEMAENFHKKIELAKPILNDQLILIDQVRTDTSDAKDFLPSKGGAIGTRNGRSGRSGRSGLVKYKSTGQVVYILYKNKNYKRTIYVKDNDKKNTRYCKINNKYILLSKLKVVE
jgi:hypothetical protein